MGQQPFQDCHVTGKEIIKYLLGLSVFMPPYVALRHLETRFPHRHRRGGRQPTGILQNLHLLSKGRFLRKDPSFPARQRRMVCFVESTSLLEIPEPLNSTVLLTVRYFTVYFYLNPSMTSSRIKHCTPTSPPRSQNSTITTY